MKNPKDQTKNRSPLHDISFGIVRIKITSQKSDFQNQFILLS